MRAGEGVPGTDVDLHRPVAHHVALVCRLERLADLGVQDDPNTSADQDGQVAISPGDVVLVHVRRRWRHAVVTAVDPTGTKGVPVIAVGYLAPAALDTAQRTWTSRYRELQALDYPAREAARARAAASDPDQASLEAEKAVRRVVLARAVAAGCPRRPWAAVVGITYVRRAPGEVFRARDQGLGVDAQSSGKRPASEAAGWSPT